MKPFLFLLGGSLALTGSAHAQLGVRVGSNLLDASKSSSANDASVRVSSGFGYQVGVFYQHALTKRLSLVPEVQFSREQAKVQLDNYSLGPNIPLRSEYRLHLSYLSVPVLLRLAVGPVYVEAGPQVSVLVGGYGKGYTTALVGGDAISVRDVEQAATDRYRRIDAGACLGLGVKLPAGLGLSVRAYQGFVPLERDYADQPYGLPGLGTKLYRQTLQASLTYQLPGS